MRVKKFFSLVLVALNILIARVHAQENQVVEGSWYKSSPEGGIIGIDLAGAKDILKNKTIVKKPIVALIGTGVDIEHEALVKSAWVNPKEKKDGLDNDKNGYIDDIHGWNYLGSKEGHSMEWTLKEDNREWVRLKDKYADIFFDGKEYFMIKDGERIRVPTPENLEEYRYFSQLRMFGQGLAGDYVGYKLAYLFKSYVEKWDKEIMKHFPDKSRSDITAEEAMKVVFDPKNPSDSITNIAATVVMLYGSVYKNFSKDKEYVTPWEILYTNFMEKQIPLAKKRFDEDYRRNGDDGRRTVVGDNSNDISDIGYGNNQLLTVSSAFGTIVSGIIAGQDVNGEGFSGVLPEAELMNLVVSGERGDPYPKDVALAIRYATANGADVIMLSQQVRLYSSEQQKWVYDAIREAEAKGVLIVVPAWEKGENLDQVVYHPNKGIGASKPLTNLMVVANSDRLGVPSKFSNYGEEGLDMFAPGISLYSTMPGDIYKMVTSPSLGAAVTAGAAAFLKAYFPKLNAGQIRTLLMENVTSRKGIEVEKNVTEGGKPIIDQFLFEQLCKSAGILNLKQATEAALKIKN